MMRGFPLRSFIKSGKTIGVVLCILLGVLISDPVFAQIGSTNNTIDLLKDDLGYALTVVIKLVSWLWIVPATIAGELMTNKFVYGSIFHLDRYLFTIWQFMRTMALFALGFLFVGTILKIYVTQEDIKGYYKLLLSTVGAGIMISMSWFLLAGLVDLSIIGTSAVSSIPLTVMEEEFNSMKGKLRCNSEITVKNFGTLDELDIQESGTNELTFEQIMPKGDSVAGPLIFIGCGMLNFFDIGAKHTGESDPVTINTLQIIKLLIALLFVIPLFILMVVNLLRIFFIWMRAIFSPIIILDYFFKGPLTKSGSGLEKYFNPKNLVGLVFQPVLVVGAIAIGMLFLMGLYDVNVGGQTLTYESMEKTFNTHPIGDNLSQVGTGVLSEAYIFGTVINKGQVWIGGFAGEVILALFSVMIFWTIVKVSLTSTAITASIAGKMYEFSETMLKTLPIVPVGGTSVGVGAIGNYYKQKVSDLTSGLRNKQAADSDRLREAFGMNNDPNELTVVQGTMIRNTASTPGVGMRTKIKEIQEKKPIDTRHRDFRKGVEDWFMANKSFLPGSLRTHNYDNDTISNIWTGTSPQDALARGVIGSILETASNPTQATISTITTPLPGRLRDTYEKQPQ